MLSCTQTTPHNGQGTYRISFFSDFRIWRISSFLAVLRCWMKSRKLLIASALERLSGSRCFLMDSQCFESCKTWLQAHTPYIILNIHTYKGCSPQKEIFPCIWQAKEASGVLLNIPDRPLLISHSCVSQRQYRGLLTLYTILLWEDHFCLLLFSSKNLGFWAYRSFHGYTRGITCEARFWLSWWNCEVFSLTAVYFGGKKIRTAEELCQLFRYRNLSENLLL